MPRRSDRTLALLLKILIAAGIAAWFLHGLDFGATAAILRAFPPGIFALAMLVQAAVQSLYAWRWKILTGRADIPYRQFLGFVSLGYVLALVSPSMLVSDSANAWFMGKRNQSVVLSISAMVAGRMLGLLALVLFFLIALPGHVWVFGLVAWHPRASFFAALLLIAAGLIAVRWINRRRPARLEKWRARARELWMQARQVFARRRAVAAGLALSVVIQGLQMILPWLGFHAMDIPVRLLDVMFFVPILTVFALVPGLGQPGVREGMVFLLFSTLPGVTKEHIVASFGYGYALFAVMGALNLAFAAWTLRLHRSGGKLYRWFFPSRGDRNPP